MSALCAPVYFQPASDKLMCTTAERNVNFYNHQIKKIRPQILYMIFLNSGPHVVTFCVNVFVGEMKIPARFTSSGNTNFPRLAWTQMNSSFFYRAFYFGF